MRRYFGLIIYLGQYADKNTEAIVSAPASCKGKLNFDLFAVYRCQHQPELVNFGYNFTTDRMVFR